MEKKKILVVDDEQAIRDMVAMTLQSAGFECLGAPNAQEAHSMIIDHAPDLVLLDWMMPGTTGIELIRRLRRSEYTAKLPIIMLTAKSSEDNKLQGLDSGADDYLTKPFSPRELLARIKAVLRRSGGEADEKTIEVGDLVFDPISHVVTIAGQAINLGPTEYRLLQFFLNNQQRVYSRGQILDHVWGGNVYMEERTVDVHIRRLRKALTPKNCDQMIQTVRGAGYRFSSKTEHISQG